VAGTINVILRSAPALRQREARASVGYRALSPQGSLRVSFSDRVGALGYQLPVTLNNWRNAASSTLQRVSRPPGAVRREDVVSARDEWRGGGLNFAPRLDWKLSESDAMQWQAYLQRNDSTSRARRSHAVIEGPPLNTVNETSGSESVWQMERLQAQWTRKRPDGTRVELKASAQSTLSRSAGEWLGRNAAEALTAQRPARSDVRAGCSPAPAAGHGAHAAGRLGPRRAAPARVAAPA
jgi:outer membrane receptor for ferrienterochelin and colicins